MDEHGEKMDMHLFQLVLSLQGGAMQQMGKIASPVSGKTERDLTMAKFSIDMIGMLQAKTKGNLTEEEDKFLSHVLYELRLNYVDETKKGDEAEEPTETKTEAAADTGEADPADPDKPDSGESTDNH